MGEVSVKGPEILKNLITFVAINKYKSVARALRKGYITELGTIAPNRSFNNRANSSYRKNTHSRSFNEYKKSIYERLKGTI